MTNNVMPEQLKVAQIRRAIRPTINSFTTTAISRNNRHSSSGLPVKPIKLHKQFEVVESTESIANLSETVPSSSDNITDSKPDIGNEIGEKVMTFKQGRVERQMRHKVEVKIVPFILFMFL